MKEDKFDRLFEKYKEGNSTLNEEQFLFDNAKNSEPSLEAWSTFAKNNKTEIPKDLNNKLWDSFQNKTNNRRRFKIGVMSAAASVILIITLFISNPVQKKLSHNEKEILLNQALNMFTDSEQEPIKENIIYEDKMIIIYTRLE